MVNTPTPMTPNSNGDPQSTETLKQSAGYIGGAIVLALAGYFGWTYFQGSNASVDTVAADKYVVIEQEAEALRATEESSNNPEALQKIETDIDALVAEHGSTIYAWQALMTKARIASDNNDFETAKQALKMALAIELNDAGLQAITKLRYAAALLANGDVDDAMSQASTDVPLPFEGSQQELLGDIYTAQKNEDSAIRSYKNAWDLLSSRSEERAILRLKLEGLGITPTPIEPEPSIVNQTSTSTASSMTSVAPSTTNAPKADSEESSTEVVDSKTLDESRNNAVTDDDISENSTKIEETDAE